MRTSVRLAVQARDEFWRQHSQREAAATGPGHRSCVPAVVRHEQPGLEHAAAWPGHVEGLLERTACCQPQSSLWNK